MEEAVVASLKCWLGHLEVAAREEEVVFVGVGRGSSRWFLRMNGLWGHPSSGQSGTLAEALSQLSEYLEGERRRFDLPIRMYGTGFQVRVWKKAMEIPYGEVRSYSWLASELGCSSPRPVGRALASNHLLIVVPCHRVVYSRGGLGGFTASLEVKEKLLIHEGACVQHVRDKTISTQD